MTPAFFLLSVIDFKMHRCQKEVFTLWKLDVVESGRRLLANWHKKSQTCTCFFFKEKIALEKWSRLEKERRLISFRLVFCFNYFSAIEPAMFLVCSLQQSQFLTNLQKNL